MIQPVFCFDFDGTLVDNSGRIHPDDKSLLSSKEPSYTFITCTGRSLESVRKTFARKGIFTDGKIPFPLVLLNGSLIYAPNEKYLDYFPFSGSIQKEIILKAGERNEITFLFLSKHQTYILGVTPFGISQISKYEFTPYPLTPRTQEIPFSKVMCISENQEALRSFLESIGSIQVEKDYSMATILELTPFHVNKGYGLQILLSRIKHEKDRVFAAGDGENDLSMAEIAEEFFVPVTAPREITACATHIIDTQKEGLLVPMINRWNELNDASLPETI